MFKSHERRYGENEQNGRGNGIVLHFAFNYSMPNKRSDKDEQQTGRGSHDQADDAFAQEDCRSDEAEQGQQVTVRGYRGDTLKAAICVDMGRYDVGIIDNLDGTYGVTADWWGVETTKGVSEEEFQNQLAQKYQYHNVKQACEEKGYSVEEEVNEEDGSIRLVVRKWVSE